MKQLKFFLYLFKNKYIVTTVVFFVWILVFDKNNLLSQIELVKKLHQLKEDQKYYELQIKQDEKDIQELLTNPETLEKFAREKYLMKRDSEDIFLIVRPVPDTLAKK